MNSPHNVSFSTTYNVIIFVTSGKQNLKGKKNFFFLVGWVFFLFVFFEGVRGNSSIGSTKLML